LFITGYSLSTRVLSEAGIEQLPNGFGEGDAAANMAMRSKTSASSETAQRLVLGPQCEPRAIEPAAPAEGRLSAGRRGMTTDDRRARASAMDGLRKTVASRLAGAGRLALPSPAWDNLTMEERYGFRT
jgi:hypothetical protein